MKFICPEEKMARWHQDKINPLYKFSYFDFCHLTHFKPCALTFAFIPITLAIKDPTILWVKKAKWKAVCPKLSQ
jgi:hypothetical protein